MARHAKTFKSMYPQLFLRLFTIAIFYSMRGYFKVAAVIIAAPLLAFLRPLLLAIMEPTRLALIELLLIFFDFCFHKNALKMRKLLLYD